MKENVLLRVSYDGTDFAGWQRQAPGKGVSVQQVLEAALSELLQERVTVAGAGRTDAGVHALAQACTFPLTRAVPLVKLPTIVNHLLPPTVRVQSAELVAADFHARFSARGKHYRYLIEQQPPSSAFGGRYTWRIDDMLDLAVMREAANCLLGTHDFRHYTVSGVSARNFVRTISRLQISCPATCSEGEAWQRLWQPVAIDVEGNGFLYKMVRIITSRLVACGRGKLPVSAVADFLDGSFWQNIPPAPACGLTLVSVLY